MLGRTTEYRTQGSRQIEDEASSIRRLDGKVTVSGGIPFSGGGYYEVWVGGWEKGGREKSNGGVGGEKADVEKVSLSLITPILLI